jgi:alpha-D-ribose 1-methylphosphonate 5-triphosphate diphosphatase
MELARADLLDILSSDYVPGGLLMSAFRIADVWDDLPRAIATVTRTPALAASLPDRGSLQTGLRGDVLRVRKAQDTPVLRGVWAKGARIA